MPKLLSESLSVETGKTGKLWRARILEANVQGSSAYYPAEVLERDGSKAFPVNTPVYMNHPTADEKWNQPERDAEKIIGYLATEAAFEPDGLYANIHIYSDKREWLLERAERIGLSIIAQGNVEETADGPRLTSLTYGQSVDVVTRAGAGGKFVTVLESAIENSAPESVAEDKEKEQNMELPKEFLEAMDALVGSVKALTERADKEDTAKAEALAEAERLAEEASKAQAPTFADIDTAMTEAELPAASRATVLTAVQGGADLVETVKAEKEKVEAILSEAGTKFSGHVSDEGKNTFAESEKVVVSGIFGR